MNDILAQLVSALEQGTRLAQATILTHEGSTPRSAGSSMLLAEDGPGLRILAGTVGGGLVEAQVMAAGAQVLVEGRRRVESFDLTGELAAGADMICGGRLRVFLERLTPADLPLFRELASALAQGGRRLRLTPLSGGRSMLLDPAAPGQSDPLSSAALAAGRGIAAPAALEHAGASYVLEPFAAASPLFIFGAGHVSRPTAQVAALCGFAVTVLDDRPEFACAERFPSARTLALASLGDCFAWLPPGASIGPEAFVVIVTRGHAHDADVLAQTLRTRAGYIGMIGSRRKREAVYERLRGQGFTDADLERVRCPIGLDIGAETPEEIAVSIAAELVQVRAGQASARRCPVGKALP